MRRPNFSDSRVWLPQADRPIGHGASVLIQLRIGFGTGLPVDSLFEEREIVVTEKMDGENTSIYADGFVHARSLDSKNHKSRDWVQKLASRVGNEGLPENLRLCGENLYARHSIAYNALPSYFMVFGIYEDDICLSWEETQDWVHLLSLDHVQSFTKVFGMRLK